MGYWGRRSRRDRGGYGWGGFAPYVPAAERRAKAAKELQKLRGKSGVVHQPVHIEGRQITRTFWGNAWCENLEAYSDFANRLPRGRTYVRNGSVLHLDIRKGAIEALVSGSSLYTIKIGIKPLAKAHWEKLRKQCAGSIGSVVELLSGKLSEAVMGKMTHRESGLFPKPSEIELDCSCPDWADMCKHVAAVLYGVGARLDAKPELLFLLRHVDHQELISQVGAVEALTAGKGATGEVVLDGIDVANVFGIELGGEPRDPVAVVAKKEGPERKTKTKTKTKAKTKAAKTTKGRPVVVRKAASKPKPRAGGTKGKQAGRRR